MKWLYVSVGHSPILPWTYSYNWLRDHISWALVELEWRLKVFPSTSNLCFEIHHTKVHSLVYNKERNTHNSQTFILYSLSQRYRDSEIEKRD